MGCSIMKNKEGSELADTTAKAVAAAVMTSEPPNNSAIQDSNNGLAKNRVHRKLNMINARTDTAEDKMRENVTQLAGGQALMAQNKSNLNVILRDHFYFSNILEEERAEILKKMKLCGVQNNQYVFKQGDPATAFFIVQEGSLQVEINGQPKKILRKGEYFGELALIYMAPRSASIKALSPCLLWYLTRQDFKKTLENTVKANYVTGKEYISKLPLFSFLTEQQKDSVAYTMIKLRYHDGQTIFKENDDANSFYIITEGQVEIVIQGKKNLILSQGDSFGEQSFLQNQFRSGTAVAKGEATCLSIGRQALKEVLGGQITNIIYYNISKWAIKRCQVLSKLSNIEVEKALQISKLMQAQDGEIVVNKGHKVNKIIICLEGSINGRPPGSVLAEEEVKSGGAISKDLVKEGTGMLAIINIEELQKILGKSLHEINQKSYALTHEKLMVQEAKKQDCSHLFLEKMLFLKKLGEGQFGKVFLVKDSETGQHYAIKCISKQSVIENKMEQILNEQKNILSSINSPFLVHFFRSFKDSHNVYFLMEYIKGCQLFETIRQIGLLSKTIAKFYIASLILCVEYLHIRNVIYRDLKPENVMVEADGYLRLIDMGTAKQLKQNNGFRTFTIIGTPHYMAPEVMLGKGYTFSVDIWTIGILLYEFVCGSLPFGQHLDDPYELHKFVLKAELKYPTFYTDLKGKALIEQMLQKRPEARINRGFAGLKASNYFDGFDWEGLYEKRLKSPYIPKKLKIPMKLPSDGPPILTYLAKEKRSPIMAQSKIPNWDADF